MKKTFTKHILLLALMLFGVAGAAWASRAPQKWTGPVDIATLVQGDTLAPGFELTGISASDYLQFDGGRYSINGTPQADPNGPSIGQANSLSYPDGNIVLTYGEATFTLAPMVDMTTAGNAWVVTDAFHPIVGSEIHLSGIYIAPDPYAPALDETTGHWNFLMPGSNKVVKAVLLDSIVVGPHVRVGGLAIEGKYANGTDTVYYYDTNSHPSLILTAADNDGQGRNFGYWSDLDPTDPEYSYYYRYISPSRFTCGDTFRAVYPENYTLTLVTPQGGGTLEIAGMTYDTVYNITFNHHDSPSGSRAITIPASRLPYDTTFNYGSAEVMEAYASEPSGKLSIINQGEHTVTIRISGAFEGNGNYGCREDGFDIWTITCTASTQPKMPYGISKTGDNTYSVMEGLTVNVTATPDSAHYLARIDGHDTVGNHACGYTFTMPSNDYPLMADFMAKPTLTLAHNDGGTVEAIIPSGAPTTAQLNVPSEWMTDNTGVSASHLPGFVAMTDEEAQAIACPDAEGTVRVIFKLDGDGYLRIIQFSNGVKDAQPFTIARGLNELYNDCNGTIIIKYYYTTGTVAPNVIAAATPNTYYIDYGTEVTLTAEAVPLYHLDRWTNQAGTEVASVTPLTVTVTSDTTLVAVFERNMRILHGVPEGWTVMADSVAVAVSADSAVVPAGARVMMIPPVPVKPTVKSFEVEKYIHPNEVPLTMEALTDGTIMVTEPKAGMRYAVNGGDKTDMSGTTQIDVTAGDKVAFYGDGTLIASYNGTKIAGGTAEVKVYGNIMSLVDEENFDTAITLTETRNFRQLFYENYKLKDASGLLLPATTLTERCYEQMFTYDTILTTAPALPATTMESNCYNNMFYYCTGLTTAPALPATTLAEYCYTYMFYGCTSLTTAPALPATTLADYCYSYMFAKCAGLTTAPALPATTLADHCYSYMFANDTNLTTAPSILPATTLSQYCYQRMFHGCIRLTTAPKLPATTLANNCYNYMFYLCTSLTTAPELPATTLVPNCYAYMFQNCSNLRSVTCMATSGINSSNSTVKWLSNTAETGIFVANNAAEWPSGTSGIPEGWNVIDYASPMALNALTDGTIKVVSPKEGMQYSLNGGAKTVMNGNTEIQVTTGDKVAFYGNGTSINKYQGTIFAGTAQVKATGNIMSLVNEEHFDTATVLTGTQAFANLFMYDTNLVDASELLMPATTLTWGCYLAMFSDCSNLTGAPKLPATTLKPSAYGNMFSGCTSLTTVPDLPATTLAGNCYANMFLGCTGLTTAPEIAATTLAENCCAAMFQNCTSLTKAPSILPATTVASGCYRNMFRGCTSLTATPVLPVESVDKSCYERMFFGCSSLNTVTCLAKTSTGFFNTYEWLSGVAATGTFITPSTTEWDENVPSGIPAGWTRVDAE